MIMTEYLAGGGDGFKVISEHKERQLQGPLDTDILKVGPRWTITEKASNRASTKIITAFRIYDNQKLPVPYLYLYFDLCISIPISRLLTAGEGPSRAGLLRDCEIFANLRLKL